MEIETKVISTEIIKPSSPTPKSLQKHRLSFLDQISPPFLMPAVFFYASNGETLNSRKHSNQLKKSFSEALTRFYPLAGRLVDNLYVDCDDGGAPFVEAEANCDLEQVSATELNPRSMSKLVPSHKLLMKESRDFCMAVQATYFRCGGAAVGILMSHRICDGLSLISFVCTWSAVAASGGDLPEPKFDAAAYFPPRDISAVEAVEEEQTVAARVFTFTAAKIDALREKYGAGLRPSRVEALSAFIWTRFLDSTGPKADPSKIYAVQHAVNLRTRTDPPLSEYHFGNLIQVATAEVAVGDGCAEIVKRIREANNAVNGAELMKEGDKYLRLMKENLGHLVNSQLVCITFSSLCRFPFYQVDLGWGKPVRVGYGGFSYKNSVYFSDTRSGDGIDAWIYLSEEDMERFEADSELQDFLSHDQTN